MSDILFHSHRMKTALDLLYFTHGEKMQTRISGNEIRDIKIYLLLVNNAYILGIKSSSKFVSYSLNKTLMTKHNAVRVSSPNYLHSINVLDGRDQKQRNISLFTYLVLGFSLESEKKKKTRPTNLPLMPLLTQMPRVLCSTGTE